MPVVDLPRRETQRGHGVETEHHKEVLTGQQLPEFTTREKRRETDLPI